MGKGKASQKANNATGFGGCHEHDESGELVIQDQRSNENEKQGLTEASMSLRALGIRSTGGLLGGYSMLCPQTNMTVATRQGSRSPV